MAGFWPTPVPPGSVAPAYLDQVRALHGTVRTWIETSAPAQKNSHLRANLPYLDLMFAFGFATLGDHATANRLIDGAYAAMNEPIPPWNASKKDYDPVAFGIIRTFLFNALRYRIEQALSGKPHVGPLSSALLWEREAIQNLAAPINNSHALAAYQIDRFREQYQIIEPTERVDPYALWVKQGDSVMNALDELRGVYEPATIVARLRKLYADGLPGRTLAEVQFQVLLDGLPLAVRVNEEFAVELLAAVRAAFFAGGEQSDMPVRRGKLLERALLLASHFDRVDIVKQLVEGYTALVLSKTGETRCRFFNAGASHCLHTMRRFRLTEEIQSFCSTMHSEVLGGASAAVLNEKHTAEPQGRFDVLVAFLHLASGWAILGRHERAVPALDAARNELLKADPPLQPKEYTELARVYVAALGQGPHESGLNGMIELFSKMPPTKITNTWTSACYYSRFHLNLVEDTVLASSRP